jgi:hypothetical protein
LEVDDDELLWSLNDGDSVVFLTHAQGSMLHFYSINICYSCLSSFSCGIAEANTLQLNNQLHTTSETTVSPAHKTATPECVSFGTQCTVPPENQW